MLHGEIKANGTTIGWWEAINKGNGHHAGQHKYECHVEVQGVAHDFELFHFRVDGAGVLASKVLWQYGLRVAT